MVGTKKDILNPVDSLHYDPQKLYGKQVHPNLAKEWGQELPHASLFPRSLTC